MLNTAGGVWHSVSVSQQQMAVGLVWLHMHRCWLGVVRLTDEIHAEGFERAYAAADIRQDEAR